MCYKAPSFRLQSLDRNNLKLCPRKANIWATAHLQKLHDPISRNNAPAFANRYEITQINFEKGRQMVIKADRNLLHWLIVAYEAGREVDLQGLLKHKIMTVPVSIAEMNGVLRTTSKPMPGDVLISGITCSSSIRPEGSLASLLMVKH